MLYYINANLKNFDFNVIQIGNMILASVKKF
jgi:hypothetical protein